MALGEKTLGGNSAPLTNSMVVGLALILVVGVPEMKLSGNFLMSSFFSFSRSSSVTWLEVALASITLATLIDSMS